MRSAGYLCSRSMAAARGAISLLARSRAVSRRRVCSGERERSTTSVVCHGSDLPLPAWRGEGDRARAASRYSLLLAGVVDLLVLGGGHRQGVAFAVGVHRQLDVVARALLVGVRCQLGGGVQ